MENLESRLLNGKVLSLTSACIMFMVDGSEEAIRVTFKENRGHIWLTRPAYTPKRLGCIRGLTPADPAFFEKVLNFVKEKR